ncbi:MAG TPA: hypothetical protein VN515_08175 [Terriglobales bacterium]|nr:hypothetical protein [Terriglobales bacterium]
MGKLQYSILAGLAGLVVLPLAAQFTGSGFYRLEKQQQTRWWVSPSGERQLLLGIDHVHLISASAPQTDLEPAYVDQRSAAIVAGLRADGFNTLGADTDADIWHRGLPYVQDLDISRHLQADQQTPLMDVYDPGFAAKVQELTRVACAPRIQDPDLVGYFSDDGLVWDPALQPDTALRYYLSLPLSAPGRQHAVDYLRDRYDSQIAKLNQAWGIKAKDFTALPSPLAPANPAALTADAKPFAAQVLVRYLQVAADAIHGVDGNHPYLGANLRWGDAGAPAPDSPEGLAWSVPDVVSVSVNGAKDPAAALRTLGQFVTKPLLVTIAGCQAPPAYAVDMFALPALVGYVWSPDGDWQGGPCAAAAAQWKNLNARASARHAR